ncbi:MAG: hypothetical protein HY318_03085 [Armatimonadetes bacterium]|nr:hypothetical protein [Armatimonadota bacterium]
MSTVGYLYDPESHASTNSRGENYWSAYIPEILDQLGASASPIRLDSFEESLQSLCVLVVGDARSIDLGAVADTIADWVESGGTLIGLAPSGLDPLFGNTFNSVTPEPDSPYHPTALVRLKPHCLTTGVYSPRFEKDPVPVFGPVRKVVAQHSTTLASLENLRCAETSFAAITHCAVGSGHACYFCFDLAQTLWLIHKGRPIEGDHDLDGYMRFSDGVVTGNLSHEVPYADLLLYLLQNLLHQAGVPMIHQIPPSNGEVADFLAFFGGDDEGLKDGTQIAASDFMRSRDLPYHINIMPYPDGTFGLTVPEYEHIVANGHEPSLHYNFIDGFSHPCGFTRDDVLRQCEAYVRTFGRKPVATVNHWCRWCGWNEPAKWMREAGGRADNSRIGASSPPLNPVNRIGFAFGTAYPNYFYEDWRERNRKIDFLSLPIAAYEVGYFGEATDFETLHQALDLAADYHYTINFFFHPIYIAKYPACREAIDELLRYTQERALRPVYFGPDALWEWWDARTRSSLDQVSLTQAETRFLARCQYDEGMVVKVPVRGESAQVSVGGVATVPVIERHFGVDYALVICPPGETEVVVTMS